MVRAEPLCTPTSAETHQECVELVVCLHTHHVRPRTVACTRQAPRHSLSCADTHGNLMYMPAREMLQPTSTRFPMWSELANLKDSAAKTERRYVWTHPHSRVLTATATTHSVQPSATTSHHTHRQHLQRGRVQRGGGEAEAHHAPSSQIHNQVTHTTP